MYERNAKATETRNVKFGMQVPFTIYAYLTTNKGIFSEIIPLNGEIGIEGIYQCRSKAL